jgi:Icc-related predicted phosphoesterase
MSQKPFKVFYVTDIHGSEICWRKFLNAGTGLGIGSQSVASAAQSKRAK